MLTVSKRQTQRVRKFNKWIQTQWLSNRASFRWTLFAFIVFVVGICAMFIYFGDSNVQIYVVKTANDHLEELAEKSQAMQETYDKEYYHWRKKELRIDYGREIWHPNFGANYPCLWTEDLISANGAVGDGAKWGCGLHHLQNVERECVIYSFGSKNDFGFEEGVNQLLPQCHIWTFDPSVSVPKVPSSINQSVDFKKWGISGEDDEEKNYFMLSTIMKKLEHSHVDILKIDVEGAEWSSFFNLDSKNEWPSIGQMLIEIHTGAYTRNHFRQLSHFNATYQAGQLMDIFEKHGLRIFHKEINDGVCCNEYSFIQKNWHPDTTNYE